VLEADSAVDQAWQEEVVSRAKTLAFLDAVSPSVAVISTGQGKPFGHPSPTLRLGLGDVPTFRTDLNGSVEFTTDGYQL
jgi:beta-lactamase superfamily II metal-dependent hydrolase